MSAPGPSTATCRGGLASGGGGEGRAGIDAAACTDAWTASTAALIAAVSYDREGEGDSEGKGLKKKKDMVDFNESLLVKLIKFFLHLRLL